MKRHWKGNGGKVSKLLYHVVETELYQDKSGITGPLNNSTKSLKGVSVKPLDRKKYKKNKGGQEECVLTKL